MSKKFLLAALAGLLVLGGCTSMPQEPIAMQPAVLEKPETRVGVALAVLPKVDTYFPGASCLVCYAAASAANMTLTTHTQKLPTGDIAQIKDDVAALLRRKGYRPVLLPATFDVKKLPSGDGAPNKPPYDFSALGRQYGIDKLIVIQFTQIGIARNYSDYFPTGIPQGTVYGTGYMVDLADNTYDWYQPIKEVRNAAGVWDEPPDYPGLTNAYFQAVEGARDAVLKPFSK